MPPYPGSVADVRLANLTCEIHCGTSRTLLRFTACGTKPTIGIPSNTASRDAPETQRGMARSLSLRHP